MDLLINYARVETPTMHTDVLNRKTHLQTFCPEVPMDLCGNQIIMSYASYKERQNETC